MKGCREIRKHVAWYLRGFPAGSELRRQMALVETVDQLRELVATLPADVPFPTDGHGPRGRQGSPAKVALPDGWLDDPDEDVVPEGAEIMHSGG